MLLFLTWAMHGMLKKCLALHYSIICYRVSASSAELEWKGETLYVDMKCWWLGARPSNHTIGIGVYETEMVALLFVWCHRVIPFGQNVGTWKCRIIWGTNWPLPKCVVWKSWQRDVAPQFCRRGVSAVHVSPSILERKRQVR
jgi:hypothetical protein